MTNKTITDASNDLSATRLTSGTIPDARVPSSAVTQHVGSIDHDSLLNFTANEHIDWTSTSSNFNTTGTVDTGALDVTGNITVSGNVDGRDVAADGTAQDSHIAASASVHGVTGDVVGTTNTQTLSGKSFSDTVNLLTQSAVRFQDSAGGEYVGLRAPTAVTSYTLDLPTAAPSAGQVLSAATASTLEWTSSLTNPMDSAGDIIVGGAGGAATKLDSGTANYLLQANGAAAPSWVNSLNISSITLSAGITVDGASVFNEVGADVDFRIEGNTNTHMFFMDASNDIIGINQATPGTKLHVTSTAGYNETFRAELGTGSTRGAAVIGDFYSSAHGDNSDYTLLRARNSAGTKFYVRGDGNVGIGTDGPLYKAEVIDSTSKSQFSWGTSTNEGGWLWSNGVNRAGILGSCSHDGTNYIARHTEASSIIFEAGATVFQNNTSLTDGNSFSPLTTMKITAAGDVGIGTTSPTSVNGLEIKRLSGGNPLIRLDATDTGGGARYITFTTTGGTGGQQGFIDTADVDTSGGANYASTSDARLKEDLGDFDGISMVLAMRPTKIRWLQGASTEHYGFMAQELYKIFPQAVSVGGDDPLESPWAIDYGKLTSVLTKAIQELSAKVEALENA